MRTLTAEVPGIPAGTQYDILEAADGTVRARWIVDRLTYGGNVHNQQPGAPRARDLYAAHLAELGVDDADEAPCGNCSSVIRAALTVCPECGADPDADVPCPDCDRNAAGEPLGGVTLSEIGLPVTCPTCNGQCQVEAPNAGSREAALKQAREWRRAQSAEANPVPLMLGPYYKTRTEMS